MQWGYLGEIVRETTPEDLTLVRPLPKCLYRNGASLSSLLATPRLAVVGSRKMTPYGAAATQAIVRPLARQGVTIISGLAYGIDALAHRIALEEGSRTIAVMAGGLHDIYPPHNRALAKEIIAQGGAVISAYELGVAPFRHNFVDRNQIIAALGDATLVCEAARQSGSLHTAHFANSIGKTVYAIPGNITEAAHAGSNALLTDFALPAIQADDVAMAFSKHNLRLALDTPAPQAHPIVELLAKQAYATTELFQRCSYSFSELQRELTMLEIEGTIKPATNGRWILA